MNKYIDELFELCNESIKIKDIPVSAIVVKDNKIVGRGYNNKTVTNDPMSHAEINAIKNACNNIGDWRLTDCDIYITLEPCDMCLEVIKEARISNIYYLVPNNDKHNTKLKVKILTCLSIFFIFFSFFLFFKN